MTKIKKELNMADFVRENKNKKQKFGRILEFINFRNFNKLLIVTIIFSGIFYVTSINDLTVKGFKLQEYKQRVSLLQDEQRNYELEVMKLESYSNLNERAEELNMVAVGAMEYLTVVNGVVAKK